jgi:hypothetical protein
MKKGDDECLVSKYCSSKPHSNPFKQKQRKQYVIVKLTGKHHTTFPPNRIKIGA